MEKRIRNELHASTLSAYLAARVAPRGLCISVKAATSHMSAKNIAQWHEILKKASLDLTRTVQNHYQHAVKDSLNTERQLYASADLSMHEIAELERYKVKKLSEIYDKKCKKLLRDGVDRSLFPKQVITAVPTNSLPELDNSTPPSTNVVNLSHVSLNRDELRVLSRGLTFCPATGGYDDFQLAKDLENFSRNMRLREYFHDRPSTSDMQPVVFTNNRWTPPAQRDKYLDMYIEAVQRDVLKAYEKQKPFKSNISFEERKAISSLAKRSDIVIKPADKGGAVVIMNKTDYISEAHRQLNNPIFYKHLDYDPTEEFKAVVQDTVNDLVKDNQLGDKAVRSLVPLSPVPGRFYLLPKIHKENCPGRPIVSGIGTVTEQLSRYVDVIISSLPCKFSSYLKDTNHFLLDIDELVIPDNSVLVTLDVVSLYTNIPHSDGIKAVIQAYEELSDEKPIGSDTLATLLKLILQLNNFEFDGSHYLQVSGTSMGTRIGPNYASLFMSVLENDFLRNRALKPLYYKRFIDDIFLIWPHGENELLSFIADFNTVHQSISFSHDYSRSTVNFLDVTVCISDNKLTTRLYRKPTDRHRYLHFKSSHVKHWKTSIPYSQALRFKRICSEQSDFYANCVQLRESLIQQQYPPRIVEDAVRRADALNRKDLFSAKKQPSVQAQSNLVLTHSASVPNVSSILKKHFNILAQSAHLKVIFPLPPRVVFRRSRNLHDILTSSKTRVPDNVGCRPCKKPRCKVCAHMTTSHIAKSTASDFFYKIKGNFTCDTYNCIYLLECSVCKLQYIGQTETPFRYRFNNHKCHAATIPNLPLSKHVHIPGHSFDNITATILQSGFRSHHERELRESYLIYKFKAVTCGMNESAGKLSFLPI